MLQSDVRLSCQKNSGEIHHRAKCDTRYVLTWRSRQSRNRLAPLRIACCALKYEELSGQMQGSFAFHPILAAAPPRRGTTRHDLSDCVVAVVFVVVCVGLDLPKRQLLSHNKRKEQ